MNAAPAIPLDHGAIGNGRVLALVAPTTHIDWLCMPRFDGPSIFARLLDVDKGGTFAMLPAEGERRTRMEYVTNTNVLRTEVTCADGRFDVFDYAPRIPAGLDADAPIEIHRLLVPREGTPRVRVLFDPKPDYARVQQPKIVPSNDGLEVGEGATAIHLRTNVPLSYLESGQALRLDEPRYFALSYGRPSRHGVGGVRAARAGSDRCRLARMGQILRAGVVRQPAGAALRPLPEAPCVHRYGRHHRRRHHEHSRGPRLRAHVGLPVLLAPRRRVRRRGAAARGTSGGR